MVSRMVCLLCPSGLSWNPKLQLYWIVSRLIFPGLSNDAAEIRCQIGAAARSFILIFPSVLNWTLMIQQWPTQRMALPSWNLSPSRACIGVGNGNPPVFLPGKFHGPRNLLDYSPWGGERIRHNWVTEHTYISWASLVAKLVKNPPAVQKTWIRSLGWEALLEKGKATHSNILAWRIPWTV